MDSLSRSQASSSLFLSNTTLMLFQLLFIIDFTTSWISKVKLTTTSGAYFYALTFALFISLYSALGG